MQNLTSRIKANRKKILAMDCYQKANRLQVFNQYFMVLTKNKTRWVNKLRANKRQYKFFQKNRNRIYPDLDIFDGLIVTKRIDKFQKEQLVSLEHLISTDRHSL